MTAEKLASACWMLRRIVR